MIRRVRQYAKRAADLIGLPRGRFFDELLNATVVGA
jgi:hypothetical protein